MQIVYKHVPYIVTNNKIFPLIYMLPRSKLNIKYSRLTRCGPEETYIEFINFFLGRT
jgi:hypothetical protein